jgi:hypothetical protein
MGLAEQRKIKEHQDKAIPAVQKQIQEACGRTVQIEIDWDSFTKDPTSLDWVGTTSGLYAVGDGVEGVCSDDLGKTAVRENLKKIAVRNVPDVAQEKLNFADGTLTVQWAWGAAQDAGNFSYTKVREALEKGL